MPKVLKVHFFLIKISVKPFLEQSTKDVESTHEILQTD